MYCVVGISGWSRPTTALIEQRAQVHVAVMFVEVEHLAALYD